MKTYHRWRWWAVALRGVAAVIFGVLALFNPTTAFMALVILFGAYAILDGVFALAFASRGASRARGSIILHGIVSIIAGVLVFAWPQISALVLLLVIAGWAIVAGILDISTAVRLRHELEHEWVLALEGALSMVFGVMLVIAPLAGAIVLGLWVGAYALVLGGLLIGTGLRIRSYEHAHPMVAAAA
jgi:uncharacterized membrane protein HdeD (DUF308 family)